MAIAFTCERCGKPFGVESALAGKRGKCMRCGHVFVIPRRAAPPADGSSRTPRDRAVVGANEPRSDAPKVTRVKGATIDVAVPAQE